MQIDARNLACPRPVVLALEALPKLAAGESLEVLVNDEVAPANLTRLAAEKDCEVATADHGDHVSVMLTPRSSTAATDGAADTAAGPVAAAAAAGACPASEAPAPAPAAAPAAPAGDKKQDAVLGAPMAGTIVPMAEVKDEAFASCALGEGVAV